MTVVPCGGYQCAQFVCLFGDSVCTSHKTHLLSTYRSSFLNSHGLSRAYMIPVKGFVSRERKKDLSLLKINLSEESEEDWTILFVLSSSLTFSNCSRKFQGFQLDAYDPAATRYTLCFTRAVTLMYCIKCSEYLGRVSCFSIGRILKIRGRYELHGGYSLAVWDMELRGTSSLRLLLLLLLLLWLLLLCLFVCLLTSWY
jgi:hypothetical protein